VTFEVSKTIGKDNRAAAEAAFTASILETLTSPKFVAAVSESTGAQVDTESVTSTVVKDETEGDDAGYIVEVLGLGVFVLLGVAILAWSAWDKTFSSKDADPPSTDKAALKLAMSFGSVESDGETPDQTIEKNELVEKGEEDDDNKDEVEAAGLDGQQEVDDDEEVLTKSQSHREARKTRKEERAKQRETIKAERAMKRKEKLLSKSLQSTSRSDAEDLEAGMGEKHKRGASVDRQPS